MRKILLGLVFGFPLLCMGEVRIGLSPVFLADDEGLLGRFSHYLEKRLGEEVRFVRRSGYREMVELVEHGSLPFAWICTRPYLQHEDSLTPIAVPLFHGRSYYRSYLIVAADVTFRDLEDLRGKVMAFADPDSLSGYMAVRRLLEGRGEEPEGFFRRTFFVYGHRNVVEAVAEGLAHAGAVSGYVWEMIAEREPQLARRTRVVWRSSPFGFPPWVAGKGASPSLRRSLAQALFAMDRDAEGKAVLEGLGLDGFIPPPPGLYREARRLTRGE